jgi:hypothetical protein
MANKRNCTYKGKFVRCIGAPKPKRVHRRKRANWEGCFCPEGSTLVPSKRKGGRGWNCVKKTSKGPRFVVADCSKAANP